MQGNNNKTVKSSFFLFTILSVLLVLSFISLYQVVGVYLSTGTVDYITFMMSFGAIALSLYLVLQIRRKPMKLGFEEPTVFSKLGCLGCDYLSVREFRNGDYILKSVETCPECKGQVFVHSIYREQDNNKK